MYRLPVKADPLPASPGISKDTVWVYLPLVDFIILYVGNYIVSSNKRWYSVSGQEMVTGPEQSELAYLNSLLVCRSSFTLSCCHAATFNRRTYIND